MKKELFTRSEVEELLMAIYRAEFKYPIADVAENNGLTDEQAVTVSTIFVMETLDEREDKGE